MNTEKFLSLPIHSKESFKSPPISRKMSDLSLMSFAFVVSTGSMLLKGVAPTTSDPISSFILLSMASLSFFLATTQLLLLPMIDATRSIGSISVILLKYLPFATLLSSLNTLALAICTLNELPHWMLVLAIQSEFVFLIVVLLGKLISKTFTSCCHHYLRVAFLTICIGFAGIHTYPLFYLPGTIKDNPIHHGIICLYIFALVPVAFVLGTILLIASVPPPGDLSIPFVPATSKEGLAVLTLAVGLTNLIIGGSLTIYAVLGNLSVAGGFGFGEAVGAIYVRSM